MKKNLLAAFTVLVVLTTVLSACAPTPVTPPEPQTIIQTVVVTQEPIVETVFVTAEPVKEVIVRTTNAAMVNDKVQLARQTYLIETFRALRPDILIMPSPYQYDAQTFAARLAAGTMEDTFLVAWSEPKMLIEKGYVADITPLAIFPHSGRWDEAEVWRQAHEHNLSPRYTTFGMMKNYPVAPGFRAARQSFLSITGKNVILSALKKAEEGEALILRVYNPSRHVTRAEIRPPFAPARVFRANLSEQPLPEDMIQPGADGMLQVEIPAGKIITLRLERDDAIL